MLVLMVIACPCAITHGKPVQTDFIALLEVDDFEALPA